MAALVTHIMCALCSRLQNEKTEKRETYWQTVGHTFTDLKVLDHY